MVESSTLLYKDKLYHGLLESVTKAGHKDKAI